MRLSLNLILTLNSLKAAATDAAAQGLFEVAKQIKSLLKQYENKSRLSQKMRADADNLLAAVYSDAPAAQVEAQAGEKPQTTAPAPAAPIALDIEALETGWAVIDFVKKDGTRREYVATRQQSLRHAANGGKPAKPAPDSVLPFVVVDEDGAPVYRSALRHLIVSIKPLPQAVADALNAALSRFVNQSQTI